MKRLLVICLCAVLCMFSLSAAKKLGIATINNKVINIYDDHTWSYAEAEKKTASYTSYYGTYKLTEDSVSDLIDMAIEEAGLSSEDAALMAMMRPMFEEAFKLMEVSITINKNNTMDLYMYEPFSGETVDEKGAAFTKVSSTAIKVDDQIVRFEDNFSCMIFEADGMKMKLFRQ